MRRRSCALSRRRILCLLGQNEACLASRSMNGTATSRRRAGEHDIIRARGGGPSRSRPSPGASFSTSAFTTWVAAQAPTVFPVGDPAKGLRALKLPPLEPRALSPAQVRSHMKLCDRLEHFHLQMALSTSGRFLLRLLVNNEPVSEVPVVATLESPKQEASFLQEATLRTRQARTTRRPPSRGRTGSIGRSTAHARASRRPEALL